MFLKPKAGLQVRDPRTLALLPESGIEVPDDGQKTPTPTDYSLAFLLKHGDVEIAEAPAEPVEPEADKHA